MNSVNQLFTEKIEGETTHYPLNTELVLQFSNEQEAARFLVEAIRFWHKKRTLFCNDVTWKIEEGKGIYVPEEEWSFNYKIPSSCGRCVHAVKVIDKIFGDQDKFNALPFVDYQGNRQYSFSFDALKYFAENGHMDGYQKKFLRLISAENNLMIDEVDGKSTIAKEKDVFRLGIDKNFKLWGTNETQDSTKETPVSVYKMHSNATLAQAFGSLSKDLDALCLTQSQIINFFTKYLTWLKLDGSLTFFLFKSKGQYFVAAVRVVYDGPCVGIIRLDEDQIWQSEYLHHIVTRKQTL